MKNSLKLIILLSFFLVTLYAEEINECKTDIYFGNGVWNEPEDAEKSIFRLQKLINKEIIKNNPKLQAKYGEVKLQYNWGQGTMLDVLETYYQLKEVGQVADYQFFAVIAILTGGNPALTFSAITSQKLIEPLTRGWEQGNVDDMSQKYYDESFKLSHKVLLVSHSQGNMFANRAYDNINPTKYKNYFANLQVASPASEVKAEKGDYVTLSTDLTSADPIINPIPGSMSPNASGDSGHAFVSAYLSQADPLTKITTKMKRLLANLDTESSQWELDQELNKGTKDYKITLKHRFDTTITSMQDIEVYPFNGSKKLYHVLDNTGGNGWVKASCGGEEVFDSWDGQEDNEVYLIDNKEEEKIIGLEIQDVLPLYNPDKSLEEHSFIIDEKAKKVLISLDDYSPCGYMYNGSYIPYQVYVYVNGQKVITLDYANVVVEEFFNVDITNIINFGTNSISAECYSYDDPFTSSNYVSVKITSYMKL